MLTLDTKLESLPRVSRKYADALGKLNLKTVGDFLMHFPFRYEDYSQRVLIENLAIGENATIMGTVLESKLIRTWKRKMLITECVIGDETGSVRAVWFNQPYVSDSLLAGKGVRLSGKVSEDKNGIFFSNPAWELSSRTPTNTGRLVPIYSETEGITSKWMRWQMQNIFNSPEGENLEIPDPIPAEVLKELHLPEIKVALKYIHFPASENEYLLAQKRFAFQTMLTVQLASLRIKKSWENENAASIPLAKKELETFEKGLPFELTNAQKKAIFEITNDLKKKTTMNRLLNGDVGSGKTIVAALASLDVALSGHQIAIMAPTEVLAKQHYESFCKIFEKHNINIALLTSANKEINNSEFRSSNFESNHNNKNSKIETLKIQSKFKIQNSKFSSAKSLRDYLLSEIKLGKADIIIGTHALIQKDVQFKNLALVIIDEQHRFGVQQRAYLQKEIAAINDGLPGKIPHLLTMTATPIPRTLTLAFFGNLDLSVLDEMPKNRLPIITKIIPNSGREKVYDFVQSEIKKGRQAFVILPLVEESEKLTELKAATQEHERLSQKIFPKLSLGLLHGKLKSGEKEKVMQDFKDGKYDILVATSVVEVGIDVPNATVIIIEDAERFGLSQLHQFRGRVGRGKHQSHCFLFTGSSTVKAKSRLRAMEKTNSGFEIAEEDLLLRGPGEFFGARQSGIPDLAMQHLGNVRLIEIAKKHALEILTADPALKNHRLLNKELAKFASGTHLE